MKNLTLFKEGPIGCQYDNENLQIIYDKIIPRIEKRFEIIFNYKQGRKGLLTEIDFSTQDYQPIIPLLDLCDSAKINMICFIQESMTDEYMGYSKSQMAGIHRSEQNQARLMAILLENEKFLEDYKVYFSTGDDLDLPIFIILKRKG